MQPIWKEMNKDLSEKIKELSRLRYAKDQAEVEAEISKRARL